MHAGGSTTKAIALNVYRNNALSSLRSADSSQALQKFQWPTIKSTMLEREPSIIQLISATTDAEGRFKFANVQRGQRIQLAYWGNNITRDA